MMVLSEGVAPDISKNSQKLLTDLGVQVPRVGAHNIPKTAPHEKYYWSLPYHNLDNNFNIKIDSNLSFEVFSKNNS
jgi:hypothetical protein